MANEEAANTGTTEATAQTTSDETVKNTGAATSGADTQAATTEAQVEKTFTQADVDRIVQTRLKTAVKAELKKLTGETEGSPTVEDLQRQLSETTTKAQRLEAKESVREYLSDPENKLSIKAENIPAITKLVMQDITFDADGKPENLKAALKLAQNLAPALFTNSSAIINAGQGRSNGSVVPSDMNAFIRRQTGHGG